MALFRAMKVSILLFCVLSHHLNKANGRCLRRAANETCPAGWSKWGNHCYKAITEHLTWDNAKDKCIEIGGVMTTPNSLEEQSHLKTLAEGLIWIDCNDIQEEGTWECKDGAADVDYRNWASGWPNSGPTGNCVNGRCFRRAAKETCPAGWSKWKNHCYKVTDEQLEWANAKDKCIEMGGVMATPNTLEEQSHLLSLAKYVDTFIWIDCSDIQEEGTWECKDGTTDVDFRNWIDGQPDSGATGNCGRLFAPGWGDVRCDLQYPSVCKQSVA
ncbi:C-type mannose receptor 2-like [Asterias amurensis]|uniref:C-type mannose receptor 2-like n=1 Tax=Asterias amurensis TaxID=7602 RepID=UPI003AB7E5A7